MLENIKQGDRNTYISNVLEGLRKKVKNFTVLDRQGQIIGEIQDLIIDSNSRLNLVISKHISQVPIYGRKIIDKHNLFRLQSQRVKKIDKSNKYVFMSIDKSEIKNMPEYLEAQTPGDNRLPDNLIEQSVNSQNVSSPIKSENLEAVEDETIIRLLEERLLIDSSKRKIGEVIVRKQVETRMVQVPVRRETLIVEQISPEHKQLAQIDLGQGEIYGVELAQLSEKQIPQLTSFDGGFTVSGEFSSPKIASLLLNAIALESNHGCQQVKVAIHVEDEAHQKKYQEWFDRCSKGQQPQPEK